MVLQFRHFFFHGIKEKKMLFFNHSTMEKISFHHGRKIVPPWWNDFFHTMERFNSSIQIY